MPINYHAPLQSYKKYYKALEPKLKKPTSRAYTTIIFSFLVVSLFGWYAIRPTIQTIIYLRREIDDKTELNKKMEDKITALIEAQAYYQEVEPLLPVLDDALPVNPQAVQLLIQLRNLASLSGTLITAIQLPSVPITKQSAGKQAVPTKNSPVSPTQTQKEFDLTLALEGPYVNLKTFLQGVLMMRRIVHVNGYTLTPLKTDFSSSQSAVPAGRMLQLALKLKAYYLIE